MNIGASIKEFRKEKGYLQKDFAKKCRISVNALCQIENNKTFPNKTTLNRISKELEIPVSFLLFYSIKEEDVAKDKKEIYKKLSPIIKEMIKQLI